MNLTSIFKFNGRKFEATKTRPQKELAGLGPVHALLHVDERYKFVTEGTIILGDHGHKFLLAGHHYTKGFNVFNCIFVTGTANLRTTTTFEHPVTRLADGRSVTNDSIIDVVYTHLSDKSDEGLRVPRAKYLLAQPVTSEDLLDGKRVKSVHKVLGVYVVETA